MEWDNYWWEKPYFYIYLLYLEINGSVYRREKRYVKCREITKDKRVKEYLLYKEVEFSNMNFCEENIK